MIEHNYSTPATQEALQRVLKSVFSAQDIASPLLSVDCTAPLAQARELIGEGKQSILGVRTEGVICGWLDESAFVCDNSADDAKTCGELARDLGELPLIDAKTSFQEVILNLAQSRVLLVKVMGEVLAFITMQNLQNAPMRMWLFGLVSLMETLMFRGIVTQMPGNSWQEHLSPGRLARTVALYEERLRRNEDIEMVDCLQFADKADILLRNPKTSKALGFTSRRQGNEFFSKLEILRNSLVHSQILSEHSLPTIVSLALSLDILLNVDKRPLLENSPEEIEDFQQMSERMRNHKLQLSAIKTLPGVAIPPPTPAGKLPPKNKKK
ncbi:hypothetical protein IJT10_04040 [bacterium]|nr:hypothetical protein [bacterium]